METTIKMECTKNKSDLEEEDIKTITEWIQTEPHLPSITELEKMLFLHACYNDIEKTKTTIDKYYTMRTRYTEFFTNRNITDIEDTKLQTISHSLLYAVLPSSTEEGHKIIVCRLLNPSPKLFHHTEAIKLFLMTTDLLVKEEGICNGVRILWDMTHCSWGHLLRINFLSLKKLMNYLQEAIPFRLKGIHVVNVSPVLDNLLTLVKPFMNKELINMIYIHVNIEDVHKFIPLECLPKDLNGCCDSYDSLKEKQLQQLAENVEWFKCDEQFYRINSEKRARSSNYSSLWNSLWG